MTVSQRRRLITIVLGMLLVTVAVIMRLFYFQIIKGPELKSLGQEIQQQIVVAQPQRGIIYDRNMAVLAGNGNDYQLGASPRLVTQAEEIATALAPILQEPRSALLGMLEDEESGYVVLAGRIAPEVAEAVRSLEFDELELTPLPRRIYPHGELLCHLLGYTDFDGVGGAGLEGYFQADLAGVADSAWVDISPLKTQTSVIAREGADLVLTIDRTLQYLVEQHLQRAIEKYQAESGTILVMDPRTGAVLAMANKPCYSPYKFFEADESLLLNPAVSQQYEPGSVMKLLTMAAALDSGTVTPQTTYYDSGTIVLGGHPIYNWDRSARGTVDMTGLLANSLNVGAATIASWMGPDIFYSYLQRFGFGRSTGVGLAAEIGGQLPLPGDETWTETNIGTNSFGQGLAVTPLQLLSAITALANNGYQMQPYVVSEIHREDGIFTHEPSVLSRPISEMTASQVSAMAVNAVRTEVYNAQVADYTVAGKTGTAQIPEGGIYHPSDTIGSFIGWLPADAPEIAVLIKLDRPSVSPWGSETAAPTFAELATEMVSLLNIPPDRVRLQRDIMAVRSN